MNAATTAYTASTQQAIEKFTLDGCLQAYNLNELKGYGPYNIAVAGNIPNCSTSTQVNEAVQAGREIISALSAHDAIAALKNLPKFHETQMQVQSQSLDSAVMLRIKDLFVIFLRQSTPPTLEQTIMRMKVEVLWELLYGTMFRVDPKAIKSFSDLHEYIDANVLGGFCDDKLSDAWIQLYGGRDNDESMPSAYMNFINDAQNAVSAWLSDGGHQFRLQSHIKTPQALRVAIASNPEIRTHALILGLAQFGRHRMFAAFYDELTVKELEEFFLLVPAAECAAK